MSAKSSTISSLVIMAVGSLKRRPLFYREADLHFQSGSMGLAAIGVAVAITEHDGGAVQGGDVAHDGQAQTGAAGVALQGGGGPVEGRKHPFALGAGDAWPAVFHLQG